MKNKLISFDPVTSVEQIEVDGQEFLILKQLIDNRVDRIYLTKPSFDNLLVYARKMWKTPKDC